MIFTYDFEYIKHHATISGGKLALELATGETAWNPVSTHGALMGPATIHYTFYDDGGVTVNID